MSQKTQNKDRASLSNKYMSWYRFSSRPSAMIGASIVILVILAAIFAPLIAPYAEHAGSFVDFRNRHLPPSFEHFMGTDNVGRDIFSRTLFGYRVSLMVVAIVLIISVPFGIIVGMTAAYFGGWVDVVLMRITDISLAIPVLILALAITAISEPGIISMMTSLIVLWWNWHARLTYSLVRSIRNEDFIEAAQLMGDSHISIMWREILPNCISAITVKITLDAGFIILISASLSFLGLGILPPTPDLGTMVVSGSDYLPERWWEAILPGGAILLAILGFNLLGDGLRDMFDVEAN